MGFDRNAYLVRWRVENREALRAYQREYMRQRRAANPEKAKEESRKNSRAQRLVNGEKIKAAERAAYHRLSPEEKRARAAKQRESSRDAIRAAAKRWAQRHPDKKNAATAQRRAARLRAMPPWVDKAALRQVYAERSRIQRETGEKYHVDHIIPLRGADVCGLHVPWNLQIIPALDNARKSNKLVL
jgi:hypothetical protein